MTQENQPNAEQLQAIQDYAKKYGRTWKQRLGSAWMDGSDAREPKGHLLRQVRNQLGPTWLISFKLPTKVTIPQPPNGHMEHGASMEDKVLDQFRLMHGAVPLNEKPMNLEFHDNRFSSPGEKVTVAFSMYAADHSPAIMLHCEDGSPYMTATVNVGVEFKAGHVAIKDYSENEDIAKLLIDNGIIQEEPKGLVELPHTSVNVYSLTDAALKEFEKARDLLLSDAPGQRRRGPAT